jgi:hypothetical protein
LANTTKIVKMKLPKNGETSGTAGTFAKAVNDAIGADTIESVSTCKAGSYIIATIIVSA